MEGQLFSYSLVFDKIYVVTHTSKVTQLTKLIDKKVGILVLNEQKEFTAIREARSNKKNASPVAKQPTKPAPPQPKPQPQWPSKIPGKPSGPDRDNNPPKNPKK